MKKKHTTLKVKWSQKKEQKRREDKIKKKRWPIGRGATHRVAYREGGGPQNSRRPRRFGRGGGAVERGRGGGRRRSPVAGRPLGRPRRRRSRARQTPRLRAVRRRVTGRVRTRPDPPDPVAPTAVRTSTECETKQNNNSSTGTERRDEGKWGRPRGGGSLGPRRTGGALGRFGRNRRLLSCQPTPTDPPRNDPALV